MAFMASEDDLDEDNLAFSRNWLVRCVRSFVFSSVLSERITYRFPKANFTTKLTDCHLYVMKKWTIEVFKHNDE